MDGDTHCSGWCDFRLCVVENRGNCLPTADEQKRAEFLRLSLKTVWSWNPTGRERTWVVDIDFWP